MITKLHTWVVNHDERWLFTIFYVGLAVTLSIWISLFWLVAVVAVHFAFEWIRQQSLHRGFLPVLREVLWELKLDIALVLFALALSLYMELILGVVGLSSAARAGAAAQAGLRSGARIAGWERAIRGVLLSVDDAAQVARAALLRRKPTEPAPTAPTLVETPVPNASETMHPFWGSWGARYGIGDWIAIGLGVSCTLLMLAAPWLTDHTIASVLTVLAEELHPFPGRD